MPQEKKVGLIGLGAMGSGIASTYLRARYEVGVYDIDRDRLDRVVASGAVAAKGAAELVRSYDTVLLSLPKSHVAVEVLENELLPVVREGSVVIDLGTTLVAETKRLAELFRKKGAHLLDVPVSGGTIGAAKGELFCFAGGDRDAVDASWSLLSVIGGGRLTYCGPSGSGQVTKAVNQLAMGLLSAACTEAVAFGVASGVDADVLLRAVGGTSGFRQLFEGVASKVVNGDGDAMDHKYAEFEYFLDEADKRQFDAPILRGLNQYMRQFPETCYDNMKRPYPPLWSSLLGKLEESS
ncbi:MAG: NAD(P)-dependent oxidoreductase [Spirochaetota bacterium]